MAAKATEITETKDNIDKLQILITSLSGDLGSHGADIKQLEKDVGKNIASQKEMTELREKENKAFEHKKVETEQAVGALEAAIKVLQGAGTGSKGTKLLASLEEANVMSVVAGVRGLLGKVHSISATDLDVVKHFVQKPSDFLGEHQSGGFLSAAQTAQRQPTVFGDYAPQSTQVQGILKSMYDSFAGDLEEGNGEEANKQKSYQELMETKKAELKTLQETLLREQTDEATKTKTVADSRKSMDESKVQLEAAENFFKESKTSCKTKAGEWADRSRMRTEELSGMTQAIEILSGDDAKETFKNASTTFLQVRAQKGRKDGALKAYNKLQSLAGKYKNLALARLAVSIKSTGHFDKVIESIDTMITVLREEETQDVEQRDRCEGDLNYNKNTQEDLTHKIDRHNKSIARSETEAEKLGEKITKIEEQINASKEEIVTITGMRNEDRAAFIQAVKDDANAVELIEKAIVKLKEFYTNNGIPLELAQQKKSPAVHNKSEPEYSDAPPETTFGDDYKGKNTQSHGIISILEMIKEDLEKETQVAREEDGKAQVAFESEKGNLIKMIQAGEATKAATESQLADLKQKIVDETEERDMTLTDLYAAEEKAAALDLDCDWVKTNFESRRDKRKVELAGLEEAKNYLAGVENGDELAEFA